MTAPGRLQQAAVRETRGAEPRPVPVRDALGTVAQRLAEVVAEHGPDAVAVYVSGQMSMEAQYLANKLAKGFLRTTQIESNSRLCMASAGTGYKQSLGSDGPPGSYEDFDHADVFLLIGSNAADCHPILFLRMMERVRAGAKLIVVDPRRTTTAEAADVFLQVRPGTDLALLNGLLHLLVEAGAVDEDFVAESTTGWERMADVVADHPPAAGVRAHRRRRGRPARRGRPHRRGRGVDELLDDGAEPEHPRHLEHQRPGQPAPGHRRDLPSRQRPLLADRPAERDGRARDGLHGPGAARAAFRPGRRGPRLHRERCGAWSRAPCAPSSSTGTVDMFARMADGEIKACWIICTNPVASVANRSTVVEALQRCEFVVVQDAFADTETTPYADVLLPAALWAESDQVAVNSERNLTLLQQAADPVGDATPDWELIAGVAAGDGLRGALRLRLRLRRVRRDPPRSPTPAPATTCAGSTTSGCAAAPVQWPAPPGDGEDRHPVRYLNDGVSQDLLVRPDGSVPRLAFPTADRAGGVLAPPLRPGRGAARRRAPVRAEHRPGAAPVAHPHQDRQGRQAQQAEPRPVRRGQPRGRGPAGDRRGGPRRGGLAPGPGRAARRRHRPRPARVLLRAVPLERRVRRGPRDQRGDQRRGGPRQLPAGVQGVRGAAGPRRGRDRRAQRPAGLRRAADPLPRRVPARPRRGARLRAGAAGVGALHRRRPGLGGRVPRRDVRRPGRRTAARPRTRRRTRTSSCSGPPRPGAPRSTPGPPPPALEAAGVRVGVFGMDEVTPDRLGTAATTLLVSSTFGDGGPPDNGESFWHALSGPSAPRLEGRGFAVLAFGDSSYADFCGHGRRLDERLAELGGQRLLERVECEPGEDERASAWSERVLGLLARRPAVPAPRSVPVPARPTRKDPYRSRLVRNHRLNAPGSTKEVRQLGFARDGGLEHRAGDSLGVWPENDPAVVAEFAAATGVDPEALAPLDLTRPAPDLLRFVAQRSREEGLAHLLAEGPSRTAEWLWGRQTLDVLRRFPAQADPAEWLNLLKPLQPRQYSISSAPEAHPDEVQLTVSTVRFGDPVRHGVCSTFLADRAGERDLRIFVQPAPAFRPPADPSVPVVMIGPGTGVAPFRAFLQHRRAHGATGANWLFFGERSSATDWYYREEFEGWREDGFLTRLSLAFSRDQPEKVYVQDRMTAHGAQLWRWIAEGAHVYVCGDASRMARDVDAALRRVVAEHGGMSEEDATLHVKAMAAEKRYVRDVYSTARVAGWPRADPAPRPVAGARRRRVGDRRPRDPAAAAAGRARTRRGPPGADPAPGGHPLGRRRPGRSRCPAVAGLPAAPHPGRGRHRRAGRLHAARGRGGRRRLRGGPRPRPGTVAGGGPGRRRDGAARRAAALARAAGRDRRRRAGHPPGGGPARGAGRPRAGAPAHRGHRRARRRARWPPRRPPAAGAVRRAAGPGAQRRGAPGRGAGGLRGDPGPAGRGARGRPLAPAARGPPRGPGRTPLRPRRGQAGALADVLRGPRRRPGADHRPALHRAVRDGRGPRRGGQDPARPRGGAGPAGRVGGPRGAARPGRRGRRRPGRGRDRRRRGRGRDGEPGDRARPAGTAAPVALRAVGGRTGRPVLLLLDNCEHLLDASALLVEDLLLR